MAMGVSEAWGIDQSDASLAQADQLNALSPYTANFLCTDIYDFPQEAPSNFDLAFIPIGVLSRTPDLARFFAAVGGLLHLSCQLVIYETHPMLQIFDPVADDAYKPTYSYFRKEGHLETKSITYDAHQKRIGSRTQWLSRSKYPLMQG